jgi:hypothetical protein
MEHNKNKDRFCFIPSSNFDLYLPQLAINVVSTSVDVGLRSDSLDYFNVYFDFFLKISILKYGLFDLDPTTTNELTA